MNDEKRILEMIEAGTITAAEGLELLNAIKVSDPVVVEEVVQTPVKKSGGKYNFLKIRVITDEDDTKVNVNIPLKLVKSLGGLTNNIQNFIPDEAQEAMDNQGINLSNFNIEEILESIEEGAIEGPLVDIDVDEDGSKTKVLIYVE